MECGGWVYDCGHFHPSDFSQIAYGGLKCDSCMAAEGILKEAERLRSRHTTAPSKWKVTHAGLTDAEIRKLTMPRQGRKS